MTIGAELHHYEIVMKISFLSSLFYNPNWKVAVDLSTQNGQNKIPKNCVRKSEKKWPIEAADDVLVTLPPRGGCEGDVIPRKPP
jgi:hypothetical protein